MIPTVVTGISNPQIRGEGLFAAGTTSFFYINFPDTMGNLYDPSDIDLTITDPNSNVIVDAVDLEKLDIGQYYYEWNIAADVTEGVFTILVAYTYHTASGATTTSYSDTFVVGEQPTDTMSNEMLALSTYLNTLLGQAQKVPVFNEIGRLNRARTIAEFTFPRWNQTPGVKVFVNEDPKESGYYVDWYNGKIQFTNALTEIDEVTASYDFRWFPTPQIYSFVEQGINVINVYPPQSIYTVLSLPERWGVVALHAAAIEGIRALMAELMWQEPIKVFGGLDRADKVFNQFDTLKKNYEDQLQKELEQKKYGPYEGLTRTITVPEYTLPGGRCFAKDTMILCKLGSHTCFSTIADIYKTYVNGLDISVLSHNEKQQVISQERIYKIWHSGIKDVYEVYTSSGKSVKTSADHLFYIVGKGYLPLKSVHVNDMILTTHNNSSISYDFVKSIMYHSKTDTYDIEVPSTENLFANGIKCHNSRWFRYLFKGSS